MTAKAEKQEVVPVAEKNTLPALLNTMFETDAGAGFEQADKDAYAIPFLAILQSGSPQCKKSDGAYVKGAEEGKLLNSVTSEVFDGGEGVRVVPCYYRRAFVEWKPKEAGSGGFAGEHEVSTALSLGAKRNPATNRDELPSGNYLVDTRYHYVLVLDADDNYKPALVTMTSTQMKKSRKWMTIMDGLKLKRPDGQPYTPPMFSHVYRLTTVPESNDKGSWFGWHVELDGVLGDAGIYAAAKALRDSIRRGDVKAQPAREAGADDDVGF